MKALVVYYSRTGTTRALAQLLGVALEAEVDAIEDRADRRGILGYLRSGRDAWLGRRTELVPSAIDPAGFDLVVIGTPVWNASLSSPVRTYLQDHARALRAIAFFCTMGGRGAARVFREMEAICHRPPLATLAQTARQVRGGDLPATIAAFVGQLRRVAVPVPVSGPSAHTASP
jgi:flavodoxin